MTDVRFKISEDEKDMCEALKPYFKTSTRAKVFRKSLKHTHDTLKNLGIIQDRKVK